MAESAIDLQFMLRNLADSDVHISVQMNLDKTQIMFNERVLPEPIALNGNSNKGNWFREDR